MPQKKYSIKQENKHQPKPLFWVSYLFPILSLTVLIFTNCQLSAVHLDCPSGDCSSNEAITQILQIFE